MGRFWSHFKTITYHKYLVARGCFKIGLYKQGLLHDMSKYSPTEFRVGVRYYQGTRSPNNAEREATGVSTAWLHHKGRNKHHYEYWQDYTTDPDRKGLLVPVPMPDKYVAEMIMDRIAACKVYRGKAYTDSAPLEYYEQASKHEQIHPETAKVLERMLRMLAEEGEKKTFECIKEELVKKKKTKESQCRENNI